MKSQQQRLTCWGILVGLVVCGVTSLLAQETWHQTTDYPMGAFQYDPVENNGRIYVLGGSTGTAFDGTYFGNINADGSLGAWTATTTLPQVDQGPGVAVHNGWIYVALGSGAVYRAELQPDGTLGSWMTEPSVEQSTSYRLGLKAYNGYLYLFGRYDGTHHNVVRIATINPDGSLGSWATATMPEPRHHQAVHFHNDRVYLVGGVTSGDAILDTVYSASVNGDGTLGTWRQEADLPTTLWYHNTVRIGNWIYLFGGRTGYFGGTVTDIYRGTINPDGTLSGWTVVEPMPSSYTVGAGAVYAPAAGRVYLIGGSSGSGFTQQVWRKDYSMVGYYPFDGDANDASGNSNHGTVTSATLSPDRFGNTNGAYQFNGASDISVTNAPPLSPRGSFTYSFRMLSTLVGAYPVYEPSPWIWFVDRTSATTPLVSLAMFTRDDGTNAQGTFWFVPRYDDGTVPGGVLTSQGVGGLAGGMLTPQQWQHITMVRQYGDSFKLYVNGTLVASAADNGKALTPPAVNLGRNPNHGQTGLVGKFDDFRIYDRALSSAEIAELYAEPGLGIAVSQVRLCWKTRTDKSYQVQYRSTLTTNNWVNLGSPIPGNGETQCITDEIVSPQRFYQVLPSP